MDFSTLRLFAMVGVFLAVTPAHADLSTFWNMFVNHEVTILKVTSDAMQGTTEIRLNLDGNSNLVSLREYPSNLPMTEFSLAQVATGAVLLNSDGHDVIKLVGQDINVHSGGPLDLIYLTNGITDSYDHFPMDLEDPASQWGVDVNDQAGHHEITTMFFQGKTLFGSVIGIEKVIVN